MKDKIKVVRVTKTTDYALPMVSDTRTTINGWTPDEVIRDWFHETPIPLSHATRDSHKIGNSDKVIRIEIQETPKPATDYENLRTSVMEYLQKLQGGHLGTPTMALLNKAGMLHAWLEDNPK